MSALNAAPQPFTLFDFKAIGKYMFNIGAPAQHFLKEAAALMQTYTQKRLERELTEECNGRLLQYGTPTGEFEFLGNLRNFLSEQYNNEVKVENLVQTAGATTALALICNALFPNKVNVYCEHLSYFLAVEILKQSGFPVKGVDTDLDGLDVDDLERQLKENSSSIEQDKANGKYSSIIYIVPVYQNPTGTVMSKEKSEKLIQVARKYNALVFCDDVYNMFHYDGTIHKRLFAYDNANDADYGRGHVISNGTFSKILAPGLRLGWMEMPTKLRESFFKTSPLLISGGSLNTYTGGIVSELLEAGKVTEQVVKIRNEQKTKMNALYGLLREHLPKECKVHTEPTGGYFLQLTLPSYVDSAKAVEALKNDHDILVHDGKKFIAETGRSYRHSELNNSIRLCIAYISLEKVQESTPLLCKTLQTLIDSTKH